MNIKQKVKNIIVLSVLFGAFSVSASPILASAVANCDATTGSSEAVDNTNNTCAGAGNNGCGVDTAIIKCDNVDVTNPGTTNNGVWSLLLTGINILTAGVGIAAVGGIVYGAILYTSAGGNADQTKKAIEFLRNVVIGIVAYAVMFSFLNFIIPGGLFG